MADVTIKFNESVLQDLDNKAVRYLEILVDEVKETAKDNAPVLTGALKNSIEVFDGADEKEKYVGSKTIPYALIQELGTVDMEPNAYLRPALDEVIKRK